MMMVYAVKHMVRTALPCVAAVLVIFSFTLLLGFMTKTITTQNKQLEEMYDKMKINCIFADPKGKTDGLMITNTVIDVCMTEDYKLSKYIDDPLFKRSLTYETQNGEAKLIGLNSNRIDNKLKDIEDTIFTGSDYVIIVNEHSSYKQDDVVNLKVSLNNEIRQVEFKVIGTYPGEDSSIIYCPWSVICDLAIMLGGQVYAESGSFVLEDNRRLSEFKNSARDYFSTVDVTGNGQTDRLSGIALIVQDSEFRSTTSAAMRNINMLETLMPIFFILSLGLGFLVSFFLTRNRYLEFDLMRRVGIKPYKIVGVSLFEQSIIALIGVCFGMILVREITSLILFICFTIGSLISSLLIFRKSVMITRCE